MKADDPFIETHKDWNMAIAWLMRLNDNCRMAEEASVNGDLIRWYRALNKIISMIHWKIAEEGNEEQEKQMYKTLNEVRVEFNRMRGKPREMIKESLTTLEIVLEDLHQQINDLLHTYNFLGMKQKVYDPGRAVEDMF